MPRALLSVYNKDGLVDFATELVQLGWDLVASGGTEQALVNANLPVTSVGQVTGVPEILGGRVKTLHPAIHGGILTRNTEEDIQTLNDLGYAPISMVVCNLYPFQETVSQVGITLQDAIEQIDIGGVTLLRAAAKNFFHVVTLSSPSDYERVVKSLKDSGEVSLSLRRDLAVQAFAQTRDYDTAIHAFLSRGTMTAMTPVTDELPAQLSLAFQKVEELRYGENAHQKGAYYSQQATQAPFAGSIVGGKKQLSYNNILDIDSAWRTVGSFSDATVVIVKHLTPTGIASGETLTQAFPLALASDSVSAFGGVIAVNRRVDDEFVTAIGSLFVEAIAAPSFAPSAQETLAQKRKNCRLVQIPQPYDGSEFDMRGVHKGILVQRRDMGDPDGTMYKTVTNRAPTSDEMDALRFAWKAAMHVKSNAIVLGIKNATVGVGGGLPSRVDAVKLAVEKAGDRAKGAVLASDAFFPFADGIEEAVKAGVTAIIQPGGSIRDAEVIDAANKADVAMVFTSTRHFRH